MEIQHFESLFQLRIHTHLYCIQCTAVTSSGYLSVLVFTAKPLHQIEIPSADTTYWCATFRTKDLVDQKVYITKVLAIMIHTLSIKLFECT